MTDKMPLILTGPPACGKTTLRMVIAQVRPDVPVAEAINLEGCDQIPEVRLAPGSDTKLELDEEMGPRWAGLTIRRDSADDLTLCAALVCAWYDTVTKPESRTGVDFVEVARGLHRLWSHQTAEMLEQVDVLLGHMNRDVMTSSPAILDAVRRIDRWRGITSIPFDGLDRLTRDRRESDARLLRSWGHL